MFATYLETLKSSHGSEELKMNNTKPTIQINNYEKSRQFEPIRLDTLQWKKGVSTSNNRNIIRNQYNILETIYFKFHN